MAYLYSGSSVGNAVTAGLAISVKTTYNRTLLETARDELVHSQFGKEYTLPKHGGLTMEWRKANVLAVATTPLTEGVIPTEDSFGYTSLTVTINQYGAFIKGTDMVQMVLLDPLLDNITEEQGVQAGLTLETIDRDALNAGTTVRYADAVANRAAIGAGNKMDAHEFVIAQRTMVTNKAKPVRGKNYAMIVHPYVAADLMEDASIVLALRAQAQGGGKNAEINGWFGEYMGIDIIRATTAKTFASTVTVYSSLVFGKNAYGIIELEGMGMETIFHPIGSSGAADPLNMFWTKGWKTTHAIKILQETYMMRIESAASA